MPTISERKKEKQKKVAKRELNELADVRDPEDLLLDASFDEIVDDEGTV